MHSSTTRKRSRPVRTPSSSDSNSNRVGWRLRGSIKNGYNYGSLHREAVCRKTVYAFARPGGLEFQWYSAIIQELIERGACAAPTAPVVTGDVKTNLAVPLQ